MSIVTQASRATRGQGWHSAAEVVSVTAIPAVEWQSFLERFGRRHRGWLATVHGVERGTPVTRAVSVPLESVMLERREREDIVRMTFINRGSLCAPRPQAIRVQINDEGAEWALEVETADGAFLRLAFRATALPDQLDGLAPGEGSGNREQLTTTSRPGCPDLRAV